MIDYDLLTTTKSILTADRQNIETGIMMVLLQNVLTAAERYKQMNANGSRQPRHEKAPVNILDLQVSEFGKELFNPQRMVSAVRRARGGGASGVPLPQSGGSSPWRRRTPYQLPQACVHCRALYQSAS